MDFGVIEPVYDVKIYRTNSSHNIVTLVFHDLDSRKRFNERINKEFSRK